MLLTTPLKIEICLYFKRDTMLHIHIVVIKFFFNKMTQGRHSPQIITEFFKRIFVDNLRLASCWYSAHSKCPHPWNTTSFTFRPWKQIMAPFIWTHFFSNDLFKRVWRKLITRSKVAHLIELLEADEII